jgi:hypothetical protein
VDIIELDVVDRHLSIEHEAGYITNGNNVGWFIRLMFAIDGDSTYPCQLQASSRYPAAFATNT